MCWTYLSPLCVGNSKGMINQGGYAKVWRGSARFANKVPDGMDPADAAALVCTGITCYSPLKRYGAGTTAKRVGIIGVGGVGHVGIMIAKAMGADVTAINRGTRKEADALKLGASKYIATGSDLEKDFEGHERSLDLIICTISECCSEILYAANVRPTAAASRRLHAPPAPHGRDRRRGHRP